MTATDSGATTSPSPAAHRHYDALFPDRTSTLAKTDPELVEHVDSFALDEVLAHGGLDERTRPSASPRGTTSPARRWTSRRGSS